MLLKSKITILNVLPLQMLSIIIVHQVLLNIKHISYIYSMVLCGCGTWNVCMCVYVYTVHAHIYIYVDIYSYANIYIYICVFAYEC